MSPPSRINCGSGCWTQWSYWAYQHNTHASNLRRTNKRTATIGLLLDDVTNPFSSTLHRAIEDVARAQGSMVLAGSHDRDATSEAQFMATVPSRGVDGLIVIPTAQSRVSMAYSRLNDRPIIFVDLPPRSMPPRISSP